MTTTTVAPSKIRKLLAIYGSYDDVAKVLGVSSRQVRYCEEGKNTSQALSRLIEIAIAYPEIIRGLSEN